MGLQTGAGCTVLWLCPETARSALSVLQNVDKYICSVPFLGHQPGVYTYCLKNRWSVNKLDTTETRSCREPVQTAAEIKMRQKYVSWEVQGKNASNTCGLDTHLGVLVSVFLRSGESQVRCSSNEYIKRTAWGGGAPFFPIKVKKTKKVKFPGVKLPGSHASCGP